MSVASTPREGTKIDLVWKGPFQIIDLISEHVYILQDPLQLTTHTAHASRIWFYEGPNWEPPPEILKLFKTNWKSLDVELIISYRISSQYGLEFEVKWLGFESTENTWEQGASLNLQIPQKVKQFILKQSKEDQKLRNQLLLPAEINHVNVKQLTNYQPNEYNATKIQSRKQFITDFITKYVNYHQNIKGRQIKPLITVQQYYPQAGLGSMPPLNLQITSTNELLAINHITRNDVKITRGWTKEENAILRLAIMKYGCGNFKTIFQHQLLIGKNKQQIYNRVQRWVRRQALSQYSNIRLDLNRVRNWNVKRTGMNYIKGEGRNAKQLHRLNKKRFEITKEEAKQIVIPFYCRILEPTHRQYILTHQSHVKVNRKMVAQYENKN